MRNSDFSTALNRPGKWAAQVNAYGKWLIHFLFSWRVKNRKGEGSSSNVTVYSHKLLELLYPRTKLVTWPRNREIFLRLLWSPTNGWGIYVISWLTITALAHPLSNETSMMAHASCTMNHQRKAISKLPGLLILGLYTICVPISGGTVVPCGQNGKN